MQSFNRNFKRIARGRVLGAIFLFGIFVWTSWYIITGPTRKFIKNYLDIPMELNETEVAYRISRLDQIVFNDHVYGPVRNDDIIIVIQVHNRYDYFRHLIASLENAANIERALLVFSHDVYDERINSIIRNITFCKYVQIFYPYMFQLYRDKFPGPDVNDCPRFTTRKEALAKKCQNALLYDRKGEYRAPDRVQIKHHWWWKAGTIFSQLYATANHDGMVLFLEEDNYVVPDLIHMLKKMVRYARENCPKCGVFTINTSRETDLSIPTNEIQISYYFKTRSMAFNRTIWKKIAKCARHFCTYDDYGWDWTVNAIQRDCLNYSIEGMTLKQPRTFHIGSCGYHFEELQCDAKMTVEEIDSNILKLRRNGYLFPETLTEVEDRSQNNIKLVGGWGDKRDHELCMNNTFY